MNYRREIDGLRALAVIPVMLFHGGFAGFGGGYVGVTVFFVISGYLITTLILTDLEAGRFSLITFYERRARRLLPALFLVMAACLPFAWLWLPPADLQSFAQSLAAVAVFASNILFWLQSGYFDSAAELKPLLHTWSLAVEEQFYVLFPWFLMLTWRLGRLRFIVLLSVLTLASMAAAQWATPNDPAGSFFLLPTRGWELAAGAFIALHFNAKDRKALPVMVQQWLSLAGLALIFFSVFAYSRDTLYPGVATLVPVIGTVLVILCGWPHTLAGRLLGSRALVGVGLISYSAYLWHQPLFAFTRHVSLGEQNPHVFAALTLLALVLAYGSWRYVEQPFRQPGRISRANVFAFAVLGSLAFLCLGLAGHWMKGAPERPMAKAFAALQYDFNMLGYRRCEDAKLTEGVTLDFCHATQRGKVDAVLIGDSHAHDKFYGIEKNDPSRHWALLGSQGCPPVTGIRVEGQQRDCPAKFEKIFAFVTGNPDITTVALTFHSNFYHRFDPPDSRAKISREDALYAGLAAAVGQLTQANKAVFVLLDVPELPFLPIDCVKGRPDCVMPLAEVMQKQTQHRRMLARLKDQFPGIGIFDPIDIVCDAGQCGYQRDGVIIYRDANHLTLAGSDQYGKAFLAWLASQGRSK